MFANMNVNTINGKLWKWEFLLYGQMGLYLKGYMGM